MLDKKQEYLIRSLDEIRDDYIAEAANFSANEEMEFEAMELVVDGSDENKSTAIVSMEELNRRKKFKNLYGTLGTIAACLVLVVSLGVYNQQEKALDANSTAGAESVEQIPGDLDPGSSTPDIDKENYGGNDQTDRSDVDIALEGAPTDGGTISGSSLMWYDPEEIFAQNIAIVRGTVKEVQTVSGTPLVGDQEDASFTLITVDIEHCLKGNLTQGETIRIRLPIVVNERGNSATPEELADLDDYYAGLHLLEIGSEGIFMPRVSKNGEYYFSEGRRYLFLESEDGVLYAKEVYEPESNGAVTLDDIEQYIQKVMNEKIIECN